MPPETTATKLWELRERLRLARDHMARAKSEMELALIRLGPLSTNWFYALEDNCECGATPTIGVLEMYKWLTSISGRCTALFAQFEDQSKEPLVQLRKRGSRRGRCPPTNWLDWKGSISRIPESELPKITQAPRGEPEA